MNKEMNQTALQMGKEYSQQLMDAAQSYENLTGFYPTADDTFFWGSNEVNKLETLSAFWWQFARSNDPFYYDDGTCAGEESL